MVASDALGAFLSAEGIEGPLLVAVSGGGDSLALLHAACDLRADERWTVAAATVDHGLREEAATEGEAVAAICADLACPHSTLRAEGLRDGRGNLMARARDVRSALLAGHARSIGGATILLAHTSDDVAETFLMRLGRASGLDGLARMHARFERHGSLWARPFLALSRAALRTELEARGVTPIEDPTNDDPAYLRTRIRRALPVLADFGLAAPAIAEAATALGEARALQVWALAGMAETMFLEQAGDLLLRNGASDLPHEGRRLLWVSALRWMGGGSYAPRRASLARFLAAADAGGGATLHGCLLARGRLSREPAAARAAPPRPAPELWDGRWRIRGSDGAPPPAHWTVAALGSELRRIGPAEGAPPYRSLLASPALYDGHRLVAAPLARPDGDWHAVSTPSFAATLRPTGGIRD